MAASKTTKNKLSESSKPAVAGNGAMDPQAQLKEIQELLFGQQMATVQSSIERLEQQNQKQFSDMDKRIAKSINELKTDMNSQLDDLAKHVESLHSEGQNRDGLIEDDLSALQNALTAFEERTEAAHSALEKQLFAEAERLAKDVSAKHENLQTQLAGASGDLSERMTERKTLAQLLMGMEKQSGQSIRLGCPIWKIKIRRMSTAQLTRLPMFPKHAIPPRLMPRAAI